MDKKMIIFRTNFYRSIICFIYVLLVQNISSNNIKIEHPQLIKQNTTNGTAIVQFNLSWENSWRTYGIDELCNHDAAWVFVKYRVSGAYGGDNVWRHARLTDNSTLKIRGFVLELSATDPYSSYNQTTNPNIGAFVYRKDPGSGDISMSDVQLCWDYRNCLKSSGNYIGDNDKVEIQVFSIEMVYVPRGQFYVGDGQSPESLHVGGGSNSPYLIPNDNSIVIGNSTNALWWDGASAETLTFYPSGYQEFYCMKYEISQQQYTDFLNTLNSSQAAIYEIVSYFDKNNRTRIVGSVGNFKAETPYVACNSLSWIDVAGFLDWSGLRPMTEFEFEKACRGNQEPTPNEFAWGTTELHQNNIINDPETDCETGEENANCQIGDQTTNLGPIRVGAFSMRNHTRSGSGGSYYGIMELSGNLHEMTITINNSYGRAFDGTHGDGNLSSSTSWPSYEGIILRGAAYTTTKEAYYPISSRYGINDILMTNGNIPDYGGRGVRSAVGLH